MKSKKCKKIAVGFFAGICITLSLVGLTACKQQFTIQEHTFTDAVENIAIDSQTADIEILPATDGQCRVISPEYESLYYKVGVQEGTLTVALEDTRKWYQYPLFNFELPTLTVYLPETEYKTLSVDASTGDIEISKELQFENVSIDLSTGDADCEALVTESIKIETSTGDIEVENATVKSMELTATTGDIEVKSVRSEDITVNVSTGAVNLEDITCVNLTSEGNTGKFSANNVQASGTTDVKRTTGNTSLFNITCANLISTADTGDLIMDNVVASGSFTIERTTGNVTFNACDAAEIEVETSTGSVTGTLLSDKIFIVRSNTGRIDVPETITGGKCKITTTTGRIEIEIKVN